MIELGLGDLNDAAGSPFMALGGLLGLESTAPA